LILSSGLEVSKPISQPLISFLTGSPRALDLKVGAAEELVARVSFLYYLNSF
jgi:hypothetical protein